MRQSLLSQRVVLAQYTDRIQHLCRKMLGKQDWTANTMPLYSTMSWQFTINGNECKVTYCMYLLLSVKCNIMNTMNSLWRRATVRTQNRTNAASHNSNNNHSKLATAIAIAAATTKKLNKNGLMLCACLRKKGYLSFKYFITCTF